MPDMCVRCFFVDWDERLEGVIDTCEIGAAPKSRWNVCAKLARRQNRGGMCVRNWRGAKIEVECVSEIGAVPKSGWNVCAKLARCQNRGGM